VTPLKLGPIGQIARSVKSVRAAEAWYREVLGLKHLYTFGEVAFFDCAGTRLLLSQQTGAQPPESIIYWTVADIHAAYETLKSRGVGFVREPHRVHRHEDGTEEWMAFFRDLEGRPLALMQQIKGP
jgi:catechol 2,3-dioxygenase-like lactoylglutathione lyase family enzyme